MGHASSVAAPLLSGLALVYLILDPVDARAQELDLRVLQDWTYYNNTGWTYLNRGDYARAEQRFKLAIERIRPYQAGHERLLARSYADLARVLYHQGRYADAEPLAAWALSVRESHPKTNPDAVFQSVYTLALIHSAQHHFAEAEKLLRRALALQEKALGAGNINTAATLDELAGVCVEQKKFALAEPLYQRAIAIQERSKPDENLDLAQTAEHFAVLLRQLNRNEEAETWQVRVRRIRDTAADRAARAQADRSRPVFQGFK